LDVGYALEERKRLSGPVRGSKEQSAERRWSGKVAIHVYGRGRDGGTKKEEISVNWG
jgi:hypothetical protein